MVGSQIVRCLEQRGKRVAIKTTTELLLQRRSEKLSEIVPNLYGDCVSTEGTNVGLILAHRYRGDNIERALSDEICITRNFVWELSEICKSLRVVVLGSITGSRVDTKMPESYHYSKDLQKSIVRQSIRISNLHMNLLELNWFEKHPDSKATHEYREKMTRIKQQLGGDSIPTIESITDFSCALIEMERPPRGQSILFDGGLSLYQKEY